MKKSIVSHLVLIPVLMMGLSACHPKSRSSDLTKTPEAPTQPQIPPDEPVDPDIKPDSKELKVGDIIFHKSQSKQSKAIKEASESDWTHVGILVSKDNEWYVAEAVGPVVTTRLEDFINRGKDREYKIYRFKYFDAKTMEDSLISAIKKQNKPYDIYFEISDESTYCSELVYKAMLEVTGHELGVVQQYKDLKLTGPQVKALIKRRLTDKGRTLDPEEPIITPVSQMIDANMTLVKDSETDSEITEQ